MGNKNNKNTEQNTNASIVNNKSAGETGNENKTMNENYKRIEKIDGWTLLEPQLTKEEQIERDYLMKKNHPDCKQAIYTKGKEYIRKLVGDHECVPMGPTEHYWDDYSGFMGCHNCIDLWKNEEKTREAKEGKEE